MPFDLIFTGGQGIVMDCHIPSLVILVSAVLVLLRGQIDRQTESNTHTHTHTHTHTRICVDMDSVTPHWSGELRP